MKTLPSRSARKMALPVTLVCACIIGFGTLAQSAAPAKPKFLGLQDAERFWWIEGAIRLTSHVIALEDKAKGECTANWYISDRDNKRRLIEKTIADNPTLGETTIIISLLEEACGRPLIPKKR